MDSTWCWSWAKRMLSYAFTGLAGVWVELPGVVKFFKALPDLAKQLEQQMPAEAQAGSIQFLRLPADVYFMGVKSLGSCIAIRQCYKDLWKLVQEYMANPDVKKRRRGFIITGTPGVGLTFMAFFVMAQLARQHKKFVYQYEGKRYYVDYSNGGAKVQVGSNSDFFVELRDKNVWLLMDDMVPEGQGRTLHPTMVFSSPKPREFDRYCKGMTTVTLYMPLWTEKELLVVVPELKPHLCAKRVQHQLQLWGGSVKRMLHPRKSTAVLHDQIIGNIKFASDLVTTAISGRTAEETSYWLVHFEPQVDGERAYRDYHAKFASGYVAKRVLQRLQALGRDELYAFFNMTSHMERCMALRQALFELWFQDLLTKGGMFKARPLPLISDEHSTVQWTLPASTVLHFNIKQVHTNITQGVWLRLEGKSHAQSLSPMCCASSKQDTGKVYIFRCLAGSCSNMDWVRVRELLNCFCPVPKEVYFVHVLLDSDYDRVSESWQVKQLADHNSPPSELCIQEWVMLVPASLAIAPQGSAQALLLPSAEMSQQPTSQDARKRRACSVEPMHSGTVKAKRQRGNK